MSTEPLQAQRMTPEEEAAARTAPTIRVKAKVLDPVPPEVVAQTRRRAFVTGVAVALGAGFAAGVGYWIIRGHRKPSRRST